MDTTRLEGSALFLLEISTQTRDKIRNFIPCCRRLSLYCAVWVPKFFHTANWETKQNNFPPFCVIVQRDFASAKLVKFFKFAAKLQSSPSPSPPAQTMFCRIASAKNHSWSRVCVFEMYLLDRLRYTPWSRRVTRLDATSTSWLLTVFESYSLLNTCYYLWSRSMGVVFQRHIVSVMQLMISSRNWFLCYIWTEPRVFYGAQVVRRLVVNLFIF
jgi:hypothetical protein